MQERLSAVFGIETGKALGRCFVVLDKSFLQGVTSSELQYYVQRGWLFGIADVLWYEHLRKWDRWRFANLVKLKSVEKHLVLLPGMGEMFRAESEKLKPASQVLGTKQVVLNEKLSMGHPFFKLDSDTKRISAERTAELEKRLENMVRAWTDFKLIPEFEGAKSEDMPVIVMAKAIQIRDDRDDMRGFYRNHRNSSNPAPELINEEWTLFRWIQVQLLAGLDFFASYGLGAPFSREELFHELLDLDYLVPAIIAGGLASRDKRMIDRFKFLRPDGVLLRS
jgi:hypothetical protein